VSDFISKLPQFSKSETKVRQRYLALRGKRIAWKTALSKILYLLLQRDEEDRLARAIECFRGEIGLSGFKLEKEVS
jgi:hypothetical protein